MASDVPVMTSELVALFQVVLSMALKSGSSSASVALRAFAVWASSSRTSEPGAYFSL